MRAIRYVMRVSAGILLILAIILGTPWVIELMGSYSTWVGNHFVHP